MHLKRSNPPQRLISLVSMIDVLLIMLVFFMVTSTYLNLDMIPMAQSNEDTGSSSAPTSSSAPMMVRLAGDGQVFLRGRATDIAKLEKTIRSRIAEKPYTKVLILPSSRASTQSLVSLMDVLTQAGVTQLRIVQLEAAQ